MGIWSGKQSLFQQTWSWGVFTQTSSRICIAALSCAVTSAAFSSSRSCSTAIPSVLDAGWAWRYWLKRALEPAKYPISTLTRRSNKGGHLEQKNVKHQLCHKWGISLHCNYCFRRNFPCYRIRYNYFSFIKMYLNTLLSHLSTVSGSFMMSSSVYSWGVRCGMGVSAGHSVFTVANHNLVNKPKQL